MSPMLLRPVAKPRTWGGDTFAAWGKFRPQPGRPPVGESWELADLPGEGGCSGIASGPFAGRSLRDAMQVEERAIMGRAHRSAVGRFPLLVKFLDTAQNLSVQVHPSPAVAQADADAHLKTESWFVLKARPGARIWRGVRPGVGRAEFERRLREGGDIVSMLIELPVRAGDCVDLPSGLCHALGAGITVAEIQTPSDTTYRLFDWNRDDPDRPLHLEQALACMAFGAAQELDRWPVTNATEMPPVLTRQFRTTLLSRTPFYRLERLEALEDAELPVVTHARPACWLVLGGRVEFEGDGGVTAGPWDSLLVPAAAEGTIARLKSGTCLLRALVPDPMDRWMA